MLRLALLFLIIALIAGLFGFTDIATASADIARIIFYIFLFFFVVVVLIVFFIARLFR